MRVNPGCDSPSIGRNGRLPPSVREQSDLHLRPLYNRVASSPIPHNSRSNAWRAARMPAYSTTAARSLAALLVLLLLNDIAHSQEPSQLRPPAVPLVTHDPYFSVWSFRDTLTEDWSRHWTGSVQAMCGLCRIDGRAYRFLGPRPEAAEAMKQTSVEVW